MMIFCVKVLLEETGQSVINYMINQVKMSDQGEYVCYGFTEDRSTYSYQSIKLIVGNVYKQKKFK